MKKAILLVIYAVALIATLIECVLLFGVYGLFIYFVLGLLYALPFKMYMKHKENKQKAQNAKIKAFKKDLSKYSDIWEMLADYAC